MPPLPGSPSPHAARSPQACCRLAVTAASVLIIDDLTHPHRPTIPSRPELQPAPPLTLRDRLCCPARRERFVLTSCYRHAGWGMPPPAVVCGFGVRDDHEEGTTPRADLLAQLFAQLPRRRVRFATRARRGGLAVAAADMGRPWVTARPVRAGGTAHRSSVLHGLPGGKASRTATAEGDQRCGPGSPNWCAARNVRRYSGCGRPGKAARPDS